MLEFAADLSTLLVERRRGSKDRGRGRRGPGEQTRRPYFAPISQRRVEPVVTHLEMFEPEHVRYRIDRSKRHPELQTSLQQFLLCVAAAKFRERLQIFFSATCLQAELILIPVPIDPG